MIIKRIEIENFGGLSNRSFDLTDGFNLIYGTNGRGKSTLMAFIKMMFYSKGGNEKSTDLLKNSRKKYRPWNGSPMSGAIVFEHEGYEYRLHKIFGKSPSSDTTTLQNITRGETASLSIAKEAGDIFLGMSAAQFERSVFIDSAGGFSSDIQDFGLAARISNLTATGDEKNSHRTVLDRLSAAKEELISKSGKKGLIAELESEISALQSKKDLLQAQISEQAELTAQIALLEEEISNDEKQLHNSELAKKVQESHKELKAYQLLLEKLKALEAAENEIQLLNNTAPKYSKSGRVALARLSRLSLIFGILTVLSAAGFTLAGLFLNKWLYSGLIISIIAFIASIYAKLRSNTSAEDNGLRTESQKLAEHIKILRHDIQTITDASNINPDIACSVSDIEQKISDITSFIEKNSRISIDDKTITVSTLRQKHSALNELYRRQSMPDGSADSLIQQIAEKTQELKNLKNRYDSLCLAESVMKDSVSETDMGLGAFLNRRTGEYLKVLNSGEYCDVLVSDSLDVNLKNTDNTRYYQWKYMSRGYIDRTYFALRLAVADAATEGSIPIPLFLDDIFAQYDDESCERALLLLKNRLMTNNGQILFFTCHKNISELSKEVFQNLGEIYI